MSADDPRIYIVALSKPIWPFTAPRVTLDDARDQVKHHNENPRFARLPARIWKIENDTTVTEIPLE